MTYAHKYTKSGGLAEVAVRFDVYQSVNGLCYNKSKDVSGYGSKYGTG